MTLTPRILFLGENWYGSCARACCYALRRLGCHVVDIDSQTIFPRLRTVVGRIGRRCAARLLVAEYNTLILETARLLKPDFLLAFKGLNVRPDTLQELRADGVPLYNYYPDIAGYIRGQMLEKSLPEYDCIFHTKPNWPADVTAFASLRRWIPVAHGYDPELHFPAPLDSRDRWQFGCDLVFIGTHTPHKEEILAELAGRLQTPDLKVWGHGWVERSEHTALRPFLAGGPAIGQTYVKAIRGAAITLAIMSGKVGGAPTGDQTSTRTFEIPACGGFMLHERTPEVLDLFHEGREIECFDTVEECAQKIRHYLARPEEREAIQAAGRRRCVPAYSYDNRMREILYWHRQWAR